MAIDVTDLSINPGRHMRHLLDTSGWPADRILSHVSAMHGIERGALQNIFSEYMRRALIQVDEQRMRLLLERTDRPLAVPPDLFAIAAKLVVAGGKHVYETANTLGLGINTLDEALRAVGIKSQHALKIEQAAAQAIERRKQAAAKALEETAARAARELAATQLIEEILERREQRQLLGRIAKDLNINRSTIYFHLKKYFRDEILNPCGIANFEQLTEQCAQGPIFLVQAQLGYLAEVNLRELHLHITASRHRINRQNLGRHAKDGRDILPDTDFLQQTDFYFRIARRAQRAIAMQSQHIPI